MRENIKELGGLGQKGELSNNRNSRKRKQKTEREEITQENFTE